MLVAAGPDGVVEASVSGLAHLARVSKAECRAALDVLENPDEDSRSPEHDGRRVEKVAGGWLVLNHAKYRERQSQSNAQAAERMRQYRERLRNERNVTRNSANVQPGSHQKQSSEAEAEAENNTASSPSGKPTHMEPKEGSPRNAARYIQDAGSTPAGSTEAGQEVIANASHAIGAGPLAEPPYSTTGLDGPREQDDATNTRRRDGPENRRCGKGEHGGAQPVAHGLRGQAQDGGAPDGSRAHSGVGTQERGAAVRESGQGGNGVEQAGGPGRGGLSDERIHLRNGGRDDSGGVVPEGEAGAGESAHRGQRGGGNGGGESLGAPGGGAAAPVSTGDVRDAATVEEHDPSVGVPSDSRAPRSRRPKEPSPEAIAAAQYLYDAIRSHSPTYKANAKPTALEATLKGWAKAIDVGMRNDGMDLEGCKEAIDVAHRSDDEGRDFSWKPNLLSGKALRKHYARLRIQGTKANGNGRAATEDIDYVGIRDEMDRICDS